MKHLLSEDNAGNGKSVLKLVDEVENIETPKKGMTFSSLNEVNIYYRSYAKKVGFGVVQKRIKKDEIGNAHYLTLGCARHGSRTPNSSNSFCKPSQTIRMGCKASFNAKLAETKWCVTSIHSEHSHHLSPRQVRFFRCNTDLDPVAKSKLETNDRAGIRMNKNYNSLAVEAGGMRILHIEKKIVVILLPSQDVYA
jgi:hypothetical protein